MSFILSIIVMATVSGFLAEGSSILRRNKNGLNGAHLKFGIYHMPPFDILSLRPDGNYTQSGSNKMLFAWLSKRLNFEISYLVISESTASKMETFYHLLTSKEIDGLTAGGIATPERKKFMDFAYFSWAEPHAMVVPRPGEEPRLFAFIKPFQPIVWTLILITAFAIVVFMSLFAKMSQLSHRLPDATNDTISTNNEHQKNMFHYACIYSIYVINVMTNQGAAVSVNRLPFRIVVGVFLLILTVLVNCYSSDIISYLTVPKLKPSINSLEDLAAFEKHGIGIVLANETVIGQWILEAKSGMLKVLGDQARNNPDRILKVENNEVSARLETERYAFPFLQTFCRFFVANQFKMKGDCRFQTSDPLPLYGFWPIVLQKDSKFTSMFNDALIEVWESGLLPFWVKQYTPQAPKCFVKIKPQTTRVQKMPIRLEDLKGVFFLLAAGIGLATFIFLLEMITNYNKLFA